MNKETSEIEKDVYLKMCDLLILVLVVKPIMMQICTIWMISINMYKIHIISTALSLVLYFYPRSIGLKLTNFFEDVVEVEVETEVEEEIEDCNACFATAY